MARRGTMYDLRPGYPVFTIDDSELGRIKDVRDNAFKIDAPWRPDYWLPQDMVLSVIPGERVTVDATEADIDRFEMDRPGMGPDEYRERYRRNYRGGMDFDPERNPEYRNYGGTTGYPDEGGSRERGDAYERSRGRADFYPQGDYDRQGQWDQQRRSARFTGEEPMKSRSGPGQWGEQYQGYQGSQRRGEQGPWYQGKPTWTGGYQEGGYGDDQDRGFPPQQRGMTRQTGPGGGGSRRFTGGGEGGDPEERRSYRGVGPKGYQRSDERIRDDVCETLADHDDLDPSDIDVQVENGEVTLTGVVETRHDKRLAEDIAADVRGVRDVHNQLKAQTSMMTGTEKKVVGW